VCAWFVCELVCMHCPCVCVFVSLLCVSSVLSGVVHFGQCVFMLVCVVFISVCWCVVVYVCPVFLCVAFVFVFVCVFSCVFVCVRGCAWCGYVCWCGCGDKTYTHARPVLRL